MQHIPALLWLAVAVAGRLIVPTPDPEDTLPFQLARFPPPGLVSEYADLATAHWKYVEANAPLNQDRAWWYDYQMEAARRANVWCLLRQAQRDDLDGPYGEPLRWAALDDLWDILGEENYRAGRLPPPMPCMDSWGDGLWSGS